MNESNIIRIVTFSLLNLCMFLIVQVIQILLLINQRSNEYLADDFALKNGYGSDLIKALYTLDKFDFSGKVSFLERIKSSHPNISSRIAKLEEKLEI